MRRLKAREYKLLLDFSRFPSAMTSARANAFWRRHVARVIDHVLDTKKGGGSRTKGEFKAPVTRRVTFWDTEEGLLAAHDYALRERADDPADASPRSLLLKLRTPDMFISGAGNLAGKADDQSVFEEDIAPLEARATGKARPSVVLASPPSMRSRFSLSLGVTCKRAEFTDYGGLSRLFPGLARDLRAQGARALAKARLHHGPVITETVFDGARSSLARTSRENSRCPSGNSLTAGRSPASPRFPTSAAPWRASCRSMRRAVPMSCSRVSSRSSATGSICAIRARPSSLCRHEKSRKSGAPSVSLRPQVKSARIWSGRTRPEIRPPAQCPSGRGKTWT